MRAALATAATAPLDPTAPGPPARPRSARRGRAVAVGAGTAMVGATLVLTGVLGGPALLGAAVVVALAVPVSRELPRRLAVVGVLAMGLAPVLWAVRVPAGVSRSGLLAVAVAAALSGWVSVDLGARARRLVPRWRAADLPLVAAVAWFGWNVRALLTAATGERVLALLLPGWDHSAHFGMATMIRAGGALVTQLPPSAVGEWAYADYPQGYHALTASVMEVLGGPRVVDGASELLLYGRSMALVSGFAALCVVAALLALPALRRRPALATALAVLVAVAFTDGAGAFLVLAGFPNFLVAAALLAAVPLLVIPLERVVAPGPLALVGAAAVGIAHNWVLLLPVAATVVVAMALPWRRRPWPPWGRAWALPLAVAVLTVAGVLWSVVILGSWLAETGILSLPGHISGTSLARLAVTVTAAVALLLLVLTRTGRPGGLSAGARSRTLAMGLAVLAGVGLAVVIAVVQLGNNGELTYYFWKVALAVELLATTVVAACLAATVPASPSGAPVRRVTRVAAVVAMGLLVAQLHGLPRALSVGETAELGSPGAQARAAWSERALEAQSELVLAAAAVEAPTDRPVVLLPYPVSVAPMSASQWVNALRWAWTDRSNELARQLPLNPEQTPEAAVATAVAVLAEDPEVVVIVGREYLDVVREGTGEPDRVVSW